MSGTQNHINVCVSTYQRPALLRRLLTELEGQETQGLFTFSVVVADNDKQGSAEKVVSECSAALTLEIVYCKEPRKGISNARNKALECSNGELIAFIDDDEYPLRDWLRNLFVSLRRYQVAGVLGPVRSDFDEAAPAWVRKAGFYQRPEYATGYEIPWQNSRTGNVLFERRIIEGAQPVFDPNFNSGGGDMDFFRRMINAGHRFVWCNEAVVYEFVPLNRCQRRFLLKRALLRGSNYSKHPEGRWQSVARSVVAIPLYTVMLPFLQLAGHHYFMRYLVKWCDHGARLASMCGVRLVKQREM